METLAVAVTYKYDMNSCKSVITLALSKLGIAGGGKAPRQTDLELGLTTLKSVYRNLISSGALGRAKLRIIDCHTVAHENDRILRVAGATGTVELPFTVTGHPIGCGDYDYGIRGAYDNRPRPPRNGSFVVVNDAQNGETGEYIYDGHRNAWTTISDLSLDDKTAVRDGEGTLLEIRTSVAPLSHDMNGLAALLAMKLADHFGQQPHPLTVRDSNRFESSLVNGFGDPDEDRATGQYW